jgi:arylsulfatase A-like enzyme
LTQSAIKPNILLLVVDCLRSDRIFSAERTCKTPHIDALVRQGISLPNVFVENSITTPSFISMLTGRYAGNHGVAGMIGAKLAKEIPTLAEIFAANGYETYAEATGPLHPLLNIGKGFAHYNFRSQYDYYFSDWGKKLLERFKNKEFRAPFFALVHFWEVHVPRQVPPEFDHPEFGATEYDRSVSAVDNYIGKILKNVDENTLIILTGDHGEAVDEVPPCRTLLPYFLNKLKLPSLSTGGKKSMENVSDLIAQEPLLHQFAHEIDRMLRQGVKKVGFWHRVKLLTDLLKIGYTRYRIQIQKGVKGGFFSDLHQKINDTILLLMVAGGNVEAAQLQLVRNSLREHTLQHGYHIYDYLQRVPAVFSWEGFLGGGRRIDSDLRHIDLLPTLIDLLKLDAPSSAMDGKSYLPHLENGEGENRPVYLEARGGAQAEKVFLIRGLRRDNDKIAFAPHEKKAPIEYYDLREDPREKQNLAPWHRNKAKALRTEADTIAATFNYAKVTKLSEKDAAEMADKLKSLGYM